MSDETKGSMHVLGREGDTKIVWDRNRADEIEAARASFATLRGKGYLAFSVKDGGDKGEQIYEFNPQAERIILAPPMRGGSDAEKIEAVVTLLHRAKERIAVGGLCKHTLREGTAYCLNGALMGTPSTGCWYSLDQEKPHLLWAAVVYVDRVLAAQLGKTVWESTRIDWNNAPERTAADVIDVLEQAAMLAKSEL